MRASAAVGDTVVAGDGRSARLELPGSHCFPAACLHWGWIRGETYLDPLRLVGGEPVRLLPLWRDLPVGPHPASLDRRTAGGGRSSTGCRSSDRQGRDQARGWACW